MRNRGQLPPPSSDVDDGVRDVWSLWEELSRLMRVLHAAKSHASVGGDGAEVNRERAAHVLLFPLARLGPLRQGALAALVHADPSTVSRHVTLLVDKGLVRRVADDRDGRANRLVVTPAGHAMLQEMCQERAVLLRRVTDGWTAEEMALFTGLIGRFVDDLTERLPVPVPVGEAATPSDTPSEKDQ
jgi:DNA-binding MarR family transcriptional regulator